VKSTINLKEIKKFGEMAKKWWDVDCIETKMLHSMNPLRLEYILKYTSLKDKKVLEVGCGGGILSLPLMRLEANLTALEPSKELWEVANLKSQEEGLKGNFLNISLEELTDGDFDVVLLMDVLEHVEEQKMFLEMAKNKLKKDGILIISTINKTLFSKIFVKFIAEDVLNIIPKGTHDPVKFISPEEICNALTNVEKLDLSGFIYNPIFGDFKFIKQIQMNYFLTLKHS
jgi:2-polyprenyl-6-hydroxyphenyl methylase/3-demethylubiquinone-9 3-methyltransferase